MSAERELHAPPNQVDLKLLGFGKKLMGKEALFWTVSFHKHPLVAPMGGRTLSRESGYCSHPV